MGDVSICTLWPFGLCIMYKGIWYIFPVLVCCTKKNLATLDPEKSQCYKTTARQ
jgi:hypothetical protein